MSSNDPIGKPQQLTAAGQIVGWRMLGSVTVFTARGASGDLREFVSLEDFQAAAPTLPAGDHAALIKRLRLRAEATVESPAPHLTGDMKFYVHDGELRTLLVEAADALARQPAAAAPREPAPAVAEVHLTHMRDNVRAALMLALYHHQGGSSPIGQPIRKMLGIGPFDNVPTPPAPSVDDLPDSAVAAWVERHDLEGALGTKADARAAFDDARTAHMIGDQT